MKWHGVSVTNNGDFVFTRPNLYTNNDWKSGTFYIYDGTSWKMIGGACTQMIPFIESGGGNVHDNNIQFLVREQYGTITNLTVSNSNRLIDANYAVLHTS